jgi:hypothetical protein
VPAPAGRAHTSAATTIAERIVQALAASILFFINTACTSFDRPLSALK